MSGFCAWWLQCLVALCLVALCLVASVPGGFSAWWHDDELIPHRPPLPHCTAPTPPYPVVQRYIPSAGFAAPGLPWVPASGMMMNSFLIGTLTQYSFMFWGVWMAFSIFIYLTYGAGW